MKHLPMRPFRWRLVLSLSIFLLATWLPQASNAQGLDEINGFMDIELGTERDSLITTMVQKRGKYQKLMRYDLMEPHLDAYGMKMHQVRLFYWDNQLHSIEVRAQGENGNKLRDWIMAMYGEGDKKDAMGFAYQWDDDKVQLFFDQNLVTKDLKLTFRSVPVHKQYYKFRYVQKYGK